MPDHHAPLLEGKIIIAVRVEDRNYLDKKMPNEQFQSDVLRERRILIVDDDEAARKLLGSYLQQLGCRIYLAKDGQDALQKAILILPDLILMDVSMPVCDGLTACTLLQQEPRTQHIPLIFLTAAVMPEERVRGLLAGAIDYVSKPFNFEEIRLRLTVHLRLLPSTLPQTLAPISASISAPILNTNKQADKEATPITNKSLASNQSHLLNRLFQTASHYLSEHLSDTPDLEQLAHLSGTNTRRLNEAFKHCVGVTAFEYLREERMKEACRLLNTTQQEIQTIGLELGFTSGANFATAFKERFGISPTQFRQGRQNDRL
ncbi:response regulator [Undibacterium sp. SXout7W]|uniref:response regulator n=1 Tax=Undibacterium sp. SXout7W TaxID=3413049 RepID=UPI003BF10238